MKSKIHEFISKRKRSMSKQKTLIFIFSVFCSMAWGQGYQTPHSLISGSGGIGQTTIGGNAETVEWTLGETFIGDGSNANFKTTIGEQQDVIKTPGVGITDVKIFDQLAIYPNPAKSTICIDNLPEGENQITLTDATGKTMQSEKATKDNIQVQLAPMPSGNYFITIRNTVSNLYKTQTLLINQ